MNTIDVRRETFAKQHEDGCFVMPNPWDIGTACYLRHLGFTALATTSAGLQFTHGQPDSVWGLAVDRVISHIEEIVTATDLPVNADFQSGYAHDEEGIAANVTACVATGVAGLSIEDAIDNSSLYDISEAVDRVKAARSAIDNTGKQVLLTARAESYLVGYPQPLDDVIRRLTAYAEAGADVLFAPGSLTASELRSIVQAVSPKPVNAIMIGHSELTVSDLAEIGVRRISVGSSLARAAWTGFIEAAEAISERGSFEGLRGAVPFSELRSVFVAQGNNDN